jgi:hypothetical protein
MNVPTENSTGHLVWEHQERIPKVSYRDFNARGKKNYARRLLLHKYFILFFFIW